MNSADVLHYFSWFGYTAVALVYTALVFRSELSKVDGPFFFSRRNAKSPSVVLITHAAFLVLLFALLRMASFVLLSLPAWMTDDTGVDSYRVSLADILFVLLLVVMHLIERRLLYEEADIGSEDGRTESDNPSAQDGE